MINAIAVKDAEALIKDGSVDIVDVRDPREWATGHVPGARLAPLDQLKANPKAFLPRDKVIFVCAKGGRSMSAAKLAEGLGMHEIYSLAGGTSAWQSAGLPIDVPAQPAVPAALAAAPVEMQAETGLDGIVGANLRDLRAQRGITLDALAKMTGLSRSLLGQIEIGRTAPSVSAVWKVARAFDVPFSALLAAHGKAKTKLLPNASAKRLVSADGRYASRALFPFGEQQVEFYELWLAPHAREDAEAHAPGTRENLVVFGGKLEIIIGSDHYELGKGDAIAFAADVAHSYVNVANEDCWMHLVMTYAHRS